jgi:hypothetical protein
MKNIPRNRCVIAWTLILIALLAVFSLIATAQMGRVPIIRVTPGISGISLSGAGIGSRAFEGIGIKALPSGGLQVGGFSSTGGEIRRYESHEVEFQGPVVVVPPPPPKHKLHLPHAHPHEEEDEWEQYCWIDSTQVMRCAYYRKR